MNVGKILGFKNVNGTIAIEQELESKEDVVTPLSNKWATGNISDVNDWLFATDGSLRYYGVEFKSQTPVDEKNLRGHIDRLHGALKGYNWIKNSPRTSVHFHLNILGHTPVQVYNAVIAYWFLEDVFMHMCAPARKGNLFCLRLQDVNGLGNLLMEDVNGTINNGYMPFEQFRGDHYRYSALNINAVNKFGSLESRAMDGTLDADRIELAGKYLINLVHRTKQFENPEVLVDEIANVGYVATANKILGPEVAAKMNFDVNFNESYERVADIAYNLDWNDYITACLAYDKRKSQPKKAGLLNTSNIPRMNELRGENLLRPDMGEDL